MIDMGQPNPTLGPVGGAVKFTNGGTVKDAAAFRARLEEFQRAANAAHGALFKRCLGEVLSGLVLANPVGNPDYWRINQYGLRKKSKRRKVKGYVGGHSRKNWQITLTPSAVGELDGAEPNARQTVNRELAVVAALPVGGGRLASVTRTSAYLVNVVPYMENLNRGRSKQAPAGWIDAVLARVMAKHARAT